MKTQKNYTTQNVASYTVFYQENRPKMTSKYPFLTADQINCRLRDQWKKLAKGEKKNFSIPKVCVTPSKVNTGIKKKVKTEDQEVKKSTPNKLFCEEDPKIASLILSKSLKQKSVADWLDTNKQKLTEPKNYSGVVNPVKDVPEVYDRTPHLKTGILKNTERSVSLEKSRLEGRTPSKVTFTPINKKGRKLAITNRFSDDFKTGDESNSFNIQPKNLKHDFEMDEDRHSEVKSYKCDFDDGGGEDECNEIDREEYSDSDDDNLLHYHQEIDEEDTQQTEESDPRTPTSKPAFQISKNSDQMVPNSSDASSEVCTTASSTPKTSKAPKTLKNGLTTPSQSKRTLRPRKRNTSQEEPVVEIPSFEKGISPKMFGLHKDRGAKRPVKVINGDLNHQEEKQQLVAEGKMLVTVTEDLKVCHVPDVNQMKEIETEPVRNSNETKKSGKKDKKRKEEDKTADDEEFGCCKPAKRKSRNKKPVYDINLRESGDFDDLGNITSKKKMKTRVLPGLFDEYDIELTSKEECIKNQDKLISEFPAFQHCENKMKNNQKEDVKNGIGYLLKKIETEKLQNENELRVKGYDTIKTIKSTPLKSKSKKSKEKQNLNLNNNNVDKELEDIDLEVLEDCDEVVKKVNQDIVDINNNSSESLDEKEDTSLFGLKSFTGSFKLGKPDSFSSCYDDDSGDVEDQLSCSNGNNTLQKILSSLRQIGSQSSVEDEENILDADDEPMDVEESPKLLSPTLSGVSELSSLSEKEHKPVDKSGKKSKEFSRRKQPSRAKQGMGKEELQDDEPPEYRDINNKVIPRGEICEMFDEISPPNKKSKKTKERRFVASNQQAGISNFGVLFHEEDIFL